MQITSIIDQQTINPDNSAPAEELPTPNSAADNESLYYIFDGSQGEQLTLVDADDATNGITIPASQEFVIGPISPQRGQLKWLLAAAPTSVVVTAVLAEGDSSVLMTDRANLSLSGALSSNGGDEVRTVDATEQRDSVTGQTTTASWEAFRTANFDVTEDYKFLSGDTFGIYVRIKLASITPSNHILSFQTSGSNGVSWRFDESDNIRAEVFNDNNRIANIDDTWSPPTGQWMFLSLIAENGTLTFQRDGSAVASTSISSPSSLLEPDPQMHFGEDAKNTDSGNIDAWWRAIVINDSPVDYDKVTSWMDGGDY